MLLPLIDLVTPNAPEAGRLLDCRPPATVGDARAAGERLVALGARNVLLTDGHLAADAEVVDVLVSAAGVCEFRARREVGGHTRGTGCRLSSAIAAFVARGETLPAACSAAQKFVGAVIESERS